MHRNAYPGARVTPSLAAGLAVALLGFACDRSPNTSGGGASPAGKQPTSAPSFAVTRPAPTGTVTWHEVRDQYAAFNRATCSDAYRQVGVHGPWDAEAIKFLERMEVYFTSGAVEEVYDPPNIPTHDELIREGRALVDGGCADPMVGYCYAAVVHDKGDVEAAAGLLREWARPLLESDYPPYRKLAAARRLLRVETEPSARQQLLGAAEYNSVMLTRGSLSYAERRKALESLEEHHEPKPPDRFMAAVQVLEEEGLSDPWLLDVLAGQAHIDLAWQARGGGWASTVTEEGWRGFYHHLQLARDRFTRAWKLAPELPEAPTKMITVAMGAGDALGEDPQTWLDRALAAQLDYTHAYDLMIGGPLLPRWGGSYEKMFALGMRAAESRRYDTILPYQLIGAVLAIVDDSDGSWAILAQPGVYEEIARVCDGYAEALKDAPERAAWYTTLRAAAAWRADRLDEARRVLDHLGDRVAPYAFKVMRSQTPQAAVGYVYAITSPEAARVRRAEAALAAGDAEAALAEFRAAGAALAAEEATHPYFEARVTLLERRQRLAGGEWVDLKPDAGLTGWQTLGGSWYVMPEDSSIFCNPPRGTPSPVLLLSDEVGPRFEVTGRLRREGPWGGGLTFRTGPRSFADVTLSARTVDVTSNGQRLHTAEVITPAEVKFACRFNRGRVTFTADGKTLVDAYDLPPEFRNNPGVGLLVLPGGRARFMDLKIRRILKDDAPAPAAQKAQEPSGGEDAE
jgi:hypothetical protein